MTSDTRDRKIVILRLRKIIDDILDHLVEDLDLKSVEIDASQAMYWEPDYKLEFDSSGPPQADLVGDLIDDWEFLRRVERGNSADHPHNLAHVYPLLRYLAHKVRQ